MSLQIAGDAPICSVLSLVVIQASLPHLLAESTAAQPLIAAASNAAVVREKIVFFILIPLK
jgi:hypothetical protein